MFRSNTLLAGSPVGYVLFRPRPPGPRSEGRSLRRGLGVVGVQSPASRTQQGKHRRREEKGGAGRHTKALSAVEPSSSVAHLRPASPLHGPHRYVAHRQLTGPHKTACAGRGPRHGRGPRAARVPATRPRPVPGSAWPAAPRTLPAYRWGPCYVRPNSHQFGFKCKCHRNRKKFKKKISVNNPGSVLSGGEKGLDFLEW